MEGGEKRKAFAKAKAESVRCLLSITKYGLYPTSILAPPWGFVPFLLPFFTPLLFLVIYLYIFIQAYSFFNFVSFYLIFYILLSSSSSILDPPLSHWVPTSELPLDKDQNLLRIPLHPCHRIS